MKKTFILIISLFMVFVLGCSGGTVKPGGEATAAPPSRSTPANTDITPSPAPSAGSDPEPTPIPDVDEAYKILEEFLRGFGFGDAEHLEIPPDRLKNGLWRATFYDKPIKRSAVLLCETEDSDFPKNKVPGAKEYRLSSYAVNVVFVETNPEYYNLETYAKVPHYLVHKEETSMIYSDATVILLNGFGITNSSYTVLTPTLPGELNNYIKYDYERVIKGQKEAGTPNSLYEIYYCDNEIFWIEQLSDLGVKGKDWEYKG